MSSSNNGPLGIHVIPTFDITNQKDMGLIIQQIESNGRIFKDGRFRTGDRIVEINNQSLIDVNFLSAQDMLRDAMKDNELVLTIIRDDKTFSSNNIEDNYERQLIIKSNNNYNQQKINNLYEQQHQYNHEFENDEHFNENGIETAELSPQNDDNNELTNDHHFNIPNYSELPNNEENKYYHSDTENNISPLFYQNSHSNNKTNLNSLNTKKIGKKIHIQLIKGPQGLGFKLAARDNPTGEISPIYVKNILPKGAAIIDGRLQRGDRLLEVNGVDMTLKTLHETVNMLRNTKLGSLVDIVISRQLNAFPRELVLNEKDCQPNTAEMNSSTIRELLTFEIPLNDTGSAGLGVSVKGKTKKHDNNESNIDLGIFVKTVINGGAASKDGRLKPNDQLININGFSLLGKSNEEAMQILREAILVETLPGHIELTVSRKRKQNNVDTNDYDELQKMKDLEFRASVGTKKQNENKNANEQPLSTNVNANCEPFNYNISENHFIKNDKAFQRNHGHGSLNFNEKRSFSRDAPTRRSMSEKRKQSSEVYSKVKINKVNDKTKNNSNPKEPNENHEAPKMFKNDSNLKTTTNTVNSKKETQNSHHFNTNGFQQITNFDGLQYIKNNNFVYSTNLKKSSSMESIPTAGHDMIKKVNDIKKTAYSSNKCIENDWDGFKVILNSNDNNYPLTNILNRQRTVNRSFRTAVDKSFDVPTSDISDDANFGMHTERMNHLRMSSQSDDMRKNKKTKKSLIETFQNFFKSNKKINQEQQKYPVELLTYNKNEEFFKLKTAASTTNKPLTLSNDIIKEKHTMRIPDEKT